MMDRYDYDERPSRYGWRLSFILLSLALLSVAWSLAAARWTDGLGVVAWVMLGGVVLGAALALSRFQGSFPHLHSAVTGFAWTIYWVSTLMPEDLTLRERVFLLGDRWLDWLIRVLTHQSSQDNLIFTLEVALVAWWLAYLAAWWVFRHGFVWRAVFPPALALLANVYYSAQNLTPFLLLFLVSALMLAMRTNLARYERYWRAARIHYPSDISLDFLRDSAVFTVLVVALAWATPAAAASQQISQILRPLEQPWHSVQEEWGRVFQALDYQSSRGQAQFGKSLTMGGARNVGDQLIATVSTTGGHYWRAVVFDTYTGNQWLNTDQITVDVDREQNIPAPAWEARTVVTSTFTTYVPGTNVLFNAGQPLRASEATQVEAVVLPEDQAMMSAPEGAALAAEQPVDVSLMISQRRLDAGEPYQVASSVSEPTVRELRESRNDYPEWVRERYLQLPDNIPERVFELARHITANRDNPYDRAAALERHLRTYEYNDQIDAPPAGHDAVDYFLFDIKEGYCDYYASSLVVMLRSVGIPARLVAGYTKGEFNEDDGLYYIRELNAHSWVEAYFSGYGWVEFEPTASEDRVNRPTGDEGERAGPPAPTPVAIPEDSPIPMDDPMFFDDGGPMGDMGDGLSGDGLLGNVSPWRGGAIVLTLMAAFGVLIMSYSLRSPVRWNPQLAERLYLGLTTWGQRLGLGLRSSQTPHEQASLLVRRVPEGRQAFENIATNYIRHRFSPEPPGREEDLAVGAAWMRLRPTLWKRWLRDQLPERWRRE